MYFRIKNCEIILELSSSFTSPDYDSNIFSQEENCLTYFNNLESKEANRKPIYIKLPSDFGAKLILENCDLSLMKGMGELKLELRQCQVLLLNFEGEIEVDLTDSVMRDIGSKGVLRGYLRQSRYLGIQAYKAISLISENSSLDFGVTSDAEGVWDISGSGNQIIFDANSSSHLMIQSLKDGWSHNGSSPKVFVNVNDDEVQLKLSDHEEDNPTTQLEIDINSEQVARLEKSLQTMEANDELMQMFDHYEDQINLEIDSLKNMDELSSSDDTANQHQTTVNRSCVSDKVRVSGQSDRRVMQLYLNKEISLDEMLFVLNGRKGE